MLVFFSSYILTVLFLFFRS